MRTEDRKERHDGVVLVWAAARAGAAYTRMVAATRHLSVRRLVTTPSWIDPLLLVFPPITINPHLTESLIDSCQERARQQLDK